jgi:hypothetical protein
VQHIRTGRTVQLSTSYVRDFVELGYATTTHTAPRNHADTMHGLNTGNQLRQLGRPSLTPPCRPS